MISNKFFIYDNIVYLIYTIADFEEMKESFLKEIQNLIPCQFGSIFMHVPPGQEDSLTMPICYPKEFGGVEEEYLKLRDKDKSIWLLNSSDLKVFRVTDLYKDSERHKSPIYLKCFQPFHLEYAVYIYLFYENKHLGTVSLYRREDMADFSEEEMTVLRQLAKHLVARFHTHDNLRPQQNPQSSSSRLYHFAEEVNLTERELQLFLSLTPYISNKELAKKYYLSEHTIKKHLQNIYRKTHTHSRLALVNLKNKLLLGEDFFFPLN